MKRERSKRTHDLTLRVAKQINVRAQSSLLASLFLSMVPSFYLITFYLMMSCSMDEDD
jgi:hypothetical protein